MSLTSELYIIFHKVRGEPALDVAQKIMIGDEDGWIVPTSGHRAYPWRSIKLEKRIPEAHHLPPIPDDWPDHYDKREYSTRPATMKPMQLPELEALLNEIGEELK